MRKRFILVVRFEQAHKLTDGVSRSLVNLFAGFILPRPVSSLLP